MTSKPDLDQLSSFSAVCWAFWPVKIILEMVHNVFEAGVYTCHVEWSVILHT